LAGEPVRNAPVRAPAVNPQTSQWAMPRARSRVRLLLEGIEGSIALAAAFLTWPLSRRWLKNWGSTVEERNRVWPGDRLVRAGHDTYTRAIDIAAASNAVWPWIVQFGLDRAGFYSYELLERLIGIPVTNLESIEESLQPIAVGDEIRLHPKAPGIPVALLESGRHICFGVEHSPGSVAAHSDPIRSWSIYLEPAGDRSCRLLLRGCIEPLREPTWGKRLGLAIESPVDFVMEQRMLRTIKRLAEM